MLTLENGSNLRIIGLYSDRIPYLAPFHTWAHLLSALLACQAISEITPETDHRGERERLHGIPSSAADAHDDARASPRCETVDDTEFLSDAEEVRVGASEGTTSSFPVHCRDRSSCC